jgi:hypothetical protein
LYGFDCPGRAGASFAGIDYRCPVGKSQPQSGLQGVVGYERGQAVYLELNARGETARKVLLQDKPEEAILNLRARQVAGTIYVLGNVYRNNGRGFIEKLAFVALEGIAHR